MTSIFALSTLRKHWSLIPVVACCGAAVALCGSYVSYMCITKPDISFSPSSWGKMNFRHCSVGPNDNVKFMRIKEPTIFPEVEKLRREISAMRNE